jgi:hypothetical protein
MAQVVECLFSKWKAQCLNSTTAKKRKRKKRMKANVENDDH